MQLDAPSISFILGTISIVAVLFAIYHFFRNPQIDSDKTAIRLREDIDNLRDIVAEVKEKHLRSVEQDIKRLTDTIQQLSLTVVQLSTVIDERIPKRNSAKTK